MDLIQTQSKKLVKLSESIKSWESGAYGKVLRMVNSETLHSLRDLWSQYSNSKRSVYPDFRRRIESVLRERYSFDMKNESIAIPLSRSLGVEATETTIISNRHMQQFWKTGVADIKDLPNDPLTNPLFLYTRKARDKFIVNDQTNPLAIFHLVTARLGEDVAEPSDQSTNGFEKVIEQVVAAAKSQFADWCTAFQEVARDSTPRIVIRFVAADPTAFCFAVQQRNNGAVRVEPSPLFSSVWSGTPLTFDGDVGDSTPLLYNVIDTSHLIDHVGLINVIVSTVPLLEQSPASTIHTDTINQRLSNETELLFRLFTSDITWMCGVLNIAPVSYLTAISTRGLLQDSPIVAESSSRSTGPSPILNRIIWKIPASGDSNVDLTQNKIRAIPETFSSFLFLIANSMMTSRLVRDKYILEGKLPFGVYTAESIGLLFALLKRRVILDWDSAIRAFLVMALSPLTNGICDSPLMEIGSSMHFTGVYTSPSLFYNVDGDPLSRDRHHRGVLSLPKPPVITCVVFTIPRRNLRAIYDECFVLLRDVIVTFEMRLYYSSKRDEHSNYRCPIPIFGKLIVSNHGKRCQIETDRNGWHGSSDLHFCICVPTTALLSESPKDEFLTLNIVSDPITKSLFRGKYGSDLEIFRTPLFDDTYVQLVESFPGCPVPKPVVTPDLPDLPAESNSEYRISYPEIKSTENQSKFQTRITLVSFFRI